MAEAPKTPAPKTLAAAVRLGEQFATVDGAIADIERRRTDRIAAINADLDAEAAPLLRQRDKLGARVTAWWEASGRGIAAADMRKSIEIGGCMVSERSAPASLVLAGDEAAIVKALQAKAWGADLLKTTVRLDKRALLKSIDGVYARDLGKMGLSRGGGEAIIAIARTAQTGTVGGA